MAFIKIVESDEEETNKKAWVVAGQGKIEEDRKKFLDAKKEILEAQKVVVADIDMPFWSMVTFMVKWAVASIPAFIALMFAGKVVINIINLLE